MFYVLCVSTRLGRGSPFLCRSRWSSRCTRRGSPCSRGRRGSPCHRCSRARMPSCHCQSRASTRRLSHPRRRVPWPWWRASWRALWWPLVASWAPPQRAWAPPQWAWAPPQWARQPRLQLSHLLRPYWQREWRRPWQRGPYSRPSSRPRSCRPASLRRQSSWSLLNRLSAPPCRPCSGAWVG